MNKGIKLIFFILILTLNFSCFENKSTEKETNKPELVVTSKTDTLKFTSGIRAIFQDSKGNYWIGSHTEGVSVYNGISFEYFTTNEGLPDNQIRSIQEDNNGKIWIGTAKGVSVYDKGTLTNYSTKTNEPKYEWNTTNGNLWFYAGEEDGINRFDGKNMNYLIFPKPKNENLNNSYGVTDISKEQDGKVWIATYAALFNYDGKMVTIFDHKTLKLKDNELLHIRSVLADSKGRIWIGNNGIGVILKKGDSITHFSKEQGKLIPMNEFEANTKTQQFAKNTGLQSVFAIEEDSEGNIWFGDRDSGAWKYDGKTLTNYKIDSKLNSQMIWNIYEDQNKNLLFGMADGSIYKFNEKGFEKQFNRQNNSKTRQEQTIEVGVTVSSLDKTIWAIYQDKSANYWFGSKENGVFFYNGQQIKQMTVKDGLVSNEIRGFQEDSVGNIFIETERGVSKFDGRTFKTLQIANPESPTNDWVLEPDDLWFRMGFSHNGLYRFDGKYLHFLKHPKSPQEDEFKSKNKNASSSYGLYTIYKDRKGIMWFGTASMGMYRFDGKTLSWHYEEQLQTTPEGGDFGTRAIFEDKEGKFWINNTRFRYNLKPNSNSNSNINFQKEDGIGYLDERNKKEFPFFLSITEDNEGNLWMVTYDNGVWKYNGKELIHYPIIDGETDVLLFTIFKDNKGVLWLGSHNAGVYKFNGKSFEKMFEK